VSRVHLYAACWNEADMLGFTFRHYDPWVERYVIFDDGSTDGSLELLADHPRVELRRLPRTHSDSLVLSLRDLYDHAWKESRGAADWVVVVNLDEHLHHPDVGGYLSACRKAGVTAVPALGYQMVSDTYPEPGSCLAESVPRGVPWEPMCKLALFDPDAIDEIDYAVGRHRAEPTGRVIYPERDELLNLHFKMIGLDRVEGRHAEQRTRLLERDRGERWGHRYLAERHETAEWMAELTAAAIEPLAPGAHPGRDHPGPRWWR
jgi:hypothetical protein